MEYQVVLIESDAAGTIIPVNNAEFMFKKLSIGDAVFLGSVGHRLTVIDKLYHSDWASPGEIATLKVAKWHPSELSRE